MKITIIGTGYVGLVAGACFADTGNEVYCVDSDEKKIKALKDGIIPIFEPGLEAMVKRAQAHGRIHFTTSTGDAVRVSEIIFMAVGTPPLPNGDSDMSFLRAAAEEVARSMEGYRLIVNKSTVPIGSHRVVAEWMSAFTKCKFDVVSNPEFLKEGSAVDDFLKPDRVVIGTDKVEVYNKMAELYAPFVRQGNPIVWMDPASAEITKYACNAFLATRISFMNELALLCETVGGDIEKVRRGMSSDTRIGKHFLYAGVGYGGSCFPKDIQALLATGKSHSIPMNVVAATESANAAQKHQLAKKVERLFGSDLRGRTLALWGLSFKPNTDDMREAPSLVIIDDLIKAGASVRAFDPIAMDNAKACLSNKDRVKLCESANEAAEGADALLLVTEWNEFRHPDFENLKKLLKNPIIFDGRNLYEPKALKAAGFAYFGMGRSNV